MPQKALPSASKTSTARDSTEKPRKVCTQALIWGGGNLPGRVSGRHIHWCFQCSYRPPFVPFCLLSTQQTAPLGPPRMHTLRESGWKSTAASSQWRAPLSRYGNTSCMEAVCFGIKPHQVFTGACACLELQGHSWGSPPKSVFPPKICFTHSFLLLPDQLL